jgi:hypothetical protein
MSEIFRLVTERRKENSKESWVNPDLNWKGIPA